MSQELLATFHTSSQPWSRRDDVPFVANHARLERLAAGGRCFVQSLAAAADVLIGEADAANRADVT